MEYSDALLPTYGLIGYPLGHSFSANFFNNKFKTENLKDYYCPFPLQDINDLPDLLNKFPTLKGLNVTSPWKEAVIPFLDEISEEAAEVNAVNTITIERKNGTTKLKGHNTDIKGFLAALSPYNESALTSALIFGSGGAARAVGEAFKKLGVEFKIVSREKNKGDLGYEEVTPGMIQSTSVLVNATPLGMAPLTDKCINIPYKAISARNFCIDLIYNPTETLFLQKSAREGASAMNGLSMLIAQAEEAWKLWNGQR